MDKLIDGQAIWACYETEHERSKYRRRITAFIHPILERWGASKVLEVGAGNGHGTIRLVELGYDCHAVDPHFRGDIADFYPYMHKGSGLSLPFIDRDFDVSFSLEVIEHVGTTDGMLALAPDFLEQRRRYPTSGFPSMNTGIHSWADSDYIRPLKMRHCRCVSLNECLLRKDLFWTGISTLEAIMLSNGLSANSVDASPPSLAFT